MNYKIIILCFFLSCFSISLAQSKIEMQNVNGVYQIPCKVNGIPMNFIFDTGASDVSISITEAKFLFKQGLLDKNDFIENVNYQIANGEIIEGLKINLKTIEIGGVLLKDVKATVIYNQNAPLLLGQSAISKLGKFSIENNQLIIQNSFGQQDNTNFKRDKISELGLNCSPVKGDQFKTNKTKINLFIEPNVNSEKITSPNKEGFWLTCVEDGIVNDFVKVELFMHYEAFQEFGIDRNTFLLFNEKLNNLNVTLEHYLKNINNDIELKKMYNLLIKNNSFENWTYEEDFYDKMKSFEGFKKYWINYDKDKLNVEYLINNQQRILFVHKNDLSMFDVGQYIMGGSEEYYLDQIEKNISYKDDNICSFNEYILAGNFNEYIKRVIDKDPFLALQKINQYYKYFEIHENQIKVEYLKMIASYKDNNFEGSVIQAKKIINDYEVNKNFIILDGKVEMYNFISLEEVYGYLISSLIQLDKFTDAYLVSNECLKDEKIQFSQFLDFHSYILITLEKKDELCEILNKEYLRGNLKAKELKIKNCN